MEEKLFMADRNSEALLPPPPPPFYLPNDGNVLNRGGGGGDYIENFKYNADDIS